MSRPAKGPGPKGFKGGAKAKDTKGTLKRVLGLIWKPYKKRFIVVLICILLSSLATVASSLFLGTLIDDYIKPMLETGANLFPNLLKAIISMAAIYCIGILSTFTFNRIMVTISQGVLKKVRDDMFNHMQTLPIKYFDTHTHGDIMSYYTNDTDTLREMISQSIPQLFNATLTITVVFISMISISLWLTLIVLLFVFIKFRCVGFIGGNSVKYYIKHQQALGKENGFIEELINGQKVVKVFCHEENAKEDFDKLNNHLFEVASKANTFANILMPVMGNLGHMLYAVLAAVGGGLAIAGVGGLTLGNVVSFLQLSKNLNMPLNQASQQINAIVMALAGAERIFELIDEEPETDNGNVTLVNSKYDEEGNLTETESRTGIWAWKEPMEDGSFSYTLLQGDVRFFDVDFGYVPEKTVLHDVSL